MHTGHTPDNHDTLSELLDELEPEFSRARADRLNSSNDKLILPDGLASVGALKGNAKISFPPTEKTVALSSNDRPSPAPATDLVAELAVLTWELEQLRRVHAAERRFDVPRKRYLRTGGGRVGLGRGDAR